VTSEKYTHQFPNPKIKTLAKLKKTTNGKY